MAKPKTPKPPKPPPKPHLFADMASWKPQETVFQGGLPRMLKIWETLRENNQHGYGSNFLANMPQWNWGWKKGKGQPSITSCSPFTGAVMGMMLDPGGATDIQTIYKPMFDNATRELPGAYYQFQNSSYFPVIRKDTDQATRDRYAALMAPFRKAGISDKQVAFWHTPAGAVEMFNVGYEIDPKDMRRGDIVGINWHSGNGHAVFVWDVHMNGEAVDAFQYISSNGGGGRASGGISIGGTQNNALFVTGSKGSYAAARSPLFADNEEPHSYITNASWMGLPGAAAIDKTSFKLAGAKINPSNPAKKFTVGSLRVARFWGFPPPTRAQDNPKYEAKFAKARELAGKAGYTQPASFATGPAKPGKPTIAKNKPKKVAAPEAKKPEVIKKLPTEKKDQQKTEILQQQLWVEQSLGELFRAGWIDKDPGAIDATYDAKTKAAVEAFQKKYKLEATDGKPGPVTRKELKRVVGLLHDSKPDPGVPKRTGKVTSFYWLGNRAAPGGSLHLAIHGENLDALAGLSVVLTCKATGKTATVAVPAITEHLRAAVAVTLPTSFPAGTEVMSKLTGGASASSNVPLYLAAAR